MQATAIRITVAIRVNQKMQRPNQRRMPFLKRFGSIPVGFVGNDVNRIKLLGRNVKGTVCIKYMERADCTTIPLDQTRRRVIPTSPSNYVAENVIGPLLALINSYQDAAALLINIRSHHTLLAQIK